jgi:PPOX class probable F420-dependent enzyme
MKIPESHVDLLEGPVFVALVTMMPDGQPQATPVWADYDGTHVIFTSAQGRQKNRNLARNPKVTVLAIDPQNPYRYLEVRGEVEEITTAGAYDHINKMAKLYTGRDDYYDGKPPNEIRDLFRIKPLKVTTGG